MSEKKSVTFGENTIKVFDLKLEIGVSYKELQYKLMNTQKQLMRSNQSKIDKCLMKWESNDEESEDDDDDWKIRHARKKIERQNKAYRGLHVINFN